jgi:DNA-binding transcriptional ArsR family regulator
MAARPATRRPAGRPSDSTSRPIIRDLSRGATSLRIDWDVRPAFDFFFSLYPDAGSSDEMPPADRAWLAENRAALQRETSGELNGALEADLAIHAGVLLLDHPDARSSADVVEVIAAAQPAAILRAIFTDQSLPNDVGDLVERAIGGDPDALPGLAECLPEWIENGRLELLADPSALQGRILTVLRAWQPRFAEIESRVAAILERDYDGRALDRERLGAADLVEATTGGVRYLPEPGISRVVLAPSYFARPYNFLMSIRDTRFFGYPVADSALDPSNDLTPPLSVVRLHRALGDETRLRILKLLSTRDLYLTEIAQLLDLSKPTIKHHLAQLRAAGLVTLTESGTVMYYSLRRHRLDDASIEIKRFLVG